jgi:hypothetical protein
VIGRQGQTAKSIRTLLRVVGAKRKSRVNLKIHEPEGSNRGPRREHDHGGHGHSHNDSGGSSSSTADLGDIDEFKL